MKSIRQVYKIGNGPSSSHTMGPKKAAEWFLRENPSAGHFKVYLYGSLAASGKGHMTDKVILEALPEGKAEVIFDREKTDIPHPNTMDFIALYPDDKEVSARVLSIGGGDIEIIGRKSLSPQDIYPQKSFAEIAQYCRENNLDLAQFAFSYEDESFREYLEKVWETMIASIKEGLKTDGILPGGLEVYRKAKRLYTFEDPGETEALREKRSVYSYAYAVAEQNASAGVIVTAPTCGASGLLPAVLYNACINENYPHDQIINALAVAGVIGTLIKANASVSGAECGCQAEIGSACSMASAALAYLKGMDIDQIEYAAEVAMEHNLGLTCDPIRGLVQIPCIERNAVCAMRAIDAVALAKYITHTHKISLDTVIETMYKTGMDLSRLYKETSQGGLAVAYTE
ncbi:MAG: L-serine ammonia-lyase, iron-sulfur-dependent, subunit alpha [Eubacteriales bacterium]|nr:L-serine ammonia-lyase, iron-sulfur-dependent, subunit alpha [Eubacteriales bacterium]